MSYGRILPALLALLWAASAWASPEFEEGTPLRVYGPGGPHHVIEECARLYEAEHGVPVAVIRAMPQELERRLSADGDIYYGGAEYMLEEFHQRNPGVLDMSSADLLHPRRIGILVRKGNPLGIAGLADLRRQGVALLDVKLENMRDFHGAEVGLSANVSSMRFTGQQGVEAWREGRGIDAWVTYRSWHFHLQDEADFIEIPGSEGLRHTPVALTARTTRRDQALDFIRFLKSPAGRKVFEEHGWD